jgi:hypothetical protein
VALRLPQPERHKGAEIDVSDEKAAAMIAQGFAEAVESAPAAAPAPTRRRRGETAL